jgi:flagellar motor protein MotB
VEEEIRRKLAAEVHVVGNRLLIEFPKISFFDFSQTELTREGRAALQAFVELYLPYAGTHLLSIRAFTDQKPVRAVRGARFQDNLELSALRAVASMRVLQRAGIPLQRMKLGGYGELNLAAAEMQRALAAQSLASPQHPTAGLALARKVAIVIEPEPPMKDKL